MIHLPKNDINKKISIQKEKRERSAAVVDVEAEVLVLKEAVEHLGVGVDEVAELRLLLSTPIFRIIVSRKRQPLKIEELKG